jgi:hypothetical protein
LKAQGKTPLGGSPSIEPATVSLAPVFDTSSIVLGRRQVPSIAMMFAGNQHHPIFDFCNDICQIAATSLVSLPGNQ